MKREIGNLWKNVSFAAAVFTLLLTGFISISAQNNAAPKLSVAEWQADVKFLGEELPKRHRNAFHRLKREDFEAAVKNLHDRVPQMNEDEIVVGLMRITAMIKDGHTNLIPRAYFRSGLFPFKVYQFSDGLFVQKAAPEYAEMVGGKIVKIGDLNADEVFKTVSQAAFADNEMGVKDIVPLMLTVPEILAGFKIIGDKQKLNLTIETGGRQKVYEIKPTGTLENLNRVPANWIDAAPPANQPLYLKDRGNMYWFEYVKDRRMLYVQHNGIGNKPDEPVAQFYKRALAVAEASPVEIFVLDLRFNGGGNNTLNRAVVIDLIKSRLNRRGKFFVIIGRETFSAAQNLVNLLERYTEATFVGEPTAAHPNHYGDNRPFVLPNSKLTVRASTLWWQDLDPRDERFWTAPEIAVELSSEDYRKNIDPAMEAVFNYKPGTTFADLVAEATSGRELSVFVKKYRDFKANPQRRFANTEADINRFGYFLLNAKRIDEAVEIFKLNVEFYPNSANVYDSLGDAYQAAGKKDEAIKAYEKALTIDPNYPSSLENLKKLKGQ
jgi:tetratricopeptide (TPR) repeat protein